jgi:hypothetical protein
MRLLALFCVFLFGVVSTAQAAHLHGVSTDAGKHRVQAPAAGSQGPSDEEHCPLCVAMHSAFPASIKIAPVPVVATSSVVRLQAEQDVSSAWHFASFSRPPPVRG